MAEFVGNVGNRKLHSIRFSDGRCKLKNIKPENKVEFDTLEDGLHYPSAERSILIPCAICIPKYKSSVLKQKG